MPKPSMEPILLPNLGIDLTKPEQFLDRALSPYSRNMEFSNEALGGRGGLVKFDNAQLSGPVLWANQFWKFSGSYDFVVFTTKDAYRYDFGNSRWDILTRIYTTGTIEVQAGTPTIVRGTGTGWSASNVKAGDFIRLSSGATYTTAQTWYTVSSVDYGTQQITLTASAPTTAAGTSYAARLTFTGSTTDIWEAKQFLDDSLGNVLIATNGVDTPVYYTGTGQVTLVTMPAGVTTAKYINIFYDRVVWMWTREAGANQPIRVRWSAVGDFNTYNAAHVTDLNLPDAQYWIKGSYLFGDNLVIVKEYKAYIGAHVDDPDIVFDFQFASNYEGNFSAESLIQQGNGVYYFGYDNRFRFYNGIKDDSFLDALFPYTINMDPAGSEFIYGYQVEGKKQFRWVLPYDTAGEVSPMIVYDYERGIPQIWEYNLTSSQKIRVIGEYLRITDLYVDDPLWADLYVDTVTPEYWDARTFLANSPVVLYGCEDGYIRTADIGTTDDGNAYWRRFRSIRLDFRAPQFNKRLWEQEWWLETQGSGTLTIKIKKGDNTSFEATTKSILMTSATKDIIKKRIRWDKESDNFQFQAEAQVHFSMLGFLNYYFPKNRRVA